MKANWLRVGLGFMLLLVLNGCATIHLGPDYDAPLKEQTLSEPANAKGKVLLVSIDGTISNQPTSGLFKQAPGLIDSVVMQLEKAAQDPEIRALLIRVNSPGGGVTASDLIYHELMQFKQKTGKAIFVQMLDVAASGGYYISLAADHIQASPTTLTGSVGVITLLPNVLELSEKIGVKVRTYTSGASKDIGSPFRAPKAGDDLYLQSLVDQMAKRFYGLVQQHRQLNADQMDDIKTAKVFLGQQALVAGLVDSVGYLTDAPNQACQLGGGQQCKLVSYRFNKNQNANAYSPTINSQADGPQLTLMNSQLLGGVLDLQPGNYYLYLP